ncbi:MAG: hypothetical protein ABW170_16525 [Candidatus Thiodiazotropha sp. L084R]
MNKSKSTIGNLSLTAPGQAQAKGQTEHESYLIIMPGGYKIMRSNAQ